MEYITISEFAELAGVTPQAIYKRIKTDLAPFVIVENGVKLINPEALSLYKDKQPAPNPSKEDFYKAEIARLTAELEDKQRIINELNNRFAQQSDKMLEIMDRQTTHFQLLLAHQQTSSQQLLTLLTPPKDTSTDEPTPQPVNEPVTKRGFFSRLFKKAP